MITTDGWKYQGKYINKLHQEFSGLFPHERHPTGLKRALAPFFGAEETHGSLN
jgi:hypothetical protein